MLISVALALEYEATCLLPEHRLATGLAHETHQRYVDTLIGVAKHVTPYFLWRPQLRDPGDEMVLETAVNGRADAIVTFNQRDFGGVPEQFGIALLRPSDALRRIRL